MIDPSDRRRFYAEEIEAVANLRTPGLVDALATVVGPTESVVAAEIDSALATRARGSPRSVRRDRHHHDDSCWLHVDGACLSMRAD